MRKKSSAPSERGVSTREYSLTARVARKTAQKGGSIAANGFIFALVVYSTQERLKAVLSTSQPIMMYIYAFIP